MGPGAMAGPRGAPALALALIAWLVPLADTKYLLGASGDFSKGCFLVGVGVYTKDMTATSGSSACNSERCPNCFMMTTDSGPAQLTIQNCHQNAFSNMFGVSVLQVFQFSNTGPNAAMIGDGTNQYILPRSGARGASMQCTCHESYGNGVLSCDSTVTPVTFTGVLATSEYLTSDACLTLSDTSNTLDMAGFNCAYKHCPHCFRFDTSSGPVTLTASNCHYYFGLDQSSMGMIEYKMVNTGANKGYVSDGTKVYTLAPYGSGGSTGTCFCNSGALVCSMDTVRAAAESTGEARFPEALSVSGYAKFGSFARMHNYRLDFSTDEYTFAQWSNPRLNFYVTTGSGSSAKALSMSSGGGTLHGTWTSDNTVTTSDRRMKRKIEPLNETLLGIQRLLAKGQEGAAAEEDDPAHWLLSRLRPISYEYVSDAKGGRRFGFLADEIEQVFPEMVRVEDDDEKKTKRVYMLDFLALLVASAQRQQVSLRQLVAQGDECRQGQQSADARLARLEETVERLAKQVEACCTARSL